jgi:hypothetical protein
VKIEIQKNIISRDKKRGCGTWNLLLREEQMVRAFESKLLRTIFGLKKEEETNHRMKVHNTEYHNLYSYFSPYIIRVIRSKNGMDGTCGTHEEKILLIFVTHSEGIIAF